MRPLATVLLIVAFAVAPVAADQCAASCELANATAGPHCHHAAGTTLRIGHLPQLCGHSHDTSVTVPAASVPSAARALALLAAVTLDTRPEPLFVAARLALASASPPHERVSDRLLVPLRI